MTRLEMLEIQLDFINEIIENRNGRAICKDLEKMLDSADKNKLLEDEARIISLQTSIISDVTNLMFIGMSEEDSLNQVRTNYIDAIVKETNENLDNLLNQFYNM